MIKENNFSIAIMLVAIIVLLIKQDSSTQLKLSSIEQSTEQLLNQVDLQPVRKQESQPQLARQRTTWHPIVYQWPSEPNGELGGLNQVSLDLSDSDPAKSEWGKETEKRLKELERRLDLLDSARTQTSAKPTKAFKPDLLSIDDSAPAPATPVILEQPQIVYYQAAPMAYSSPISYGSTGSSQLPSTSSAYGSGSFGQSSSGFSQPTYSTRIVRRPVQQIQATSYGPVMGTRLGSRVGNFFGQECPGGVCPR